MSSFVNILLTTGSAYQGIDQVFGIQFSKGLGMSNVKCIKIVDKNVGLKRLFGFDKFLGFHSI